MKRLVAVVLAIGLLGGGGYALAAATTGTVSVCSSASVPAQTIAVNGNPVTTVPAATDSECATTMYTVPTVTTTQTVTTTVTVPVGGSGGNAEVYVSASGNDATCSRNGSPCATLNKAYQIAQPGDTVQVGCGNYGAQTLNADASKAGSTSYVMFQPAGSGVCWNQTGPISFAGASYVELDNVAYNGGIGNAYTGNVDMADIFTAGNHIVINGQSGGRFDVGGTASYVTIENSDLGNCTGNTVAVCVNRTESSSASNIVVKNTAMHDIKYGAACSCHVDGIALFGVNGITLNRDLFYNDDVTNIRIQNDSGLIGNENHNVVIENSWFGDVWNGGNILSPINVDSQTDGLVIAFDSFSAHVDSTGTKHPGYVQCTGGSPDTNSTGTGCGTPLSAALLYGNLFGGNTGCPTNAAFSYNVFVPFSQYTGQTACGATDTKVAAIPYTNDPATGKPDFTVTGAAWAGDNSVPTASIPAGWPVLDYFGNKRPLDANADAGSVERTP